MNTSEVAKRMIDGEIGVLHGMEYYWTGSLFKVRDPAITHVWEVAMALPHSNCWQIKKEPIKYSKYIWLDLDPNADGGNNEEYILPFLFNRTIGLRWDVSRTDECNKRYKITVEECPETQEK